MLKLCRVTKVKVFFLVMVYVFNFDLFELLAVILEKGLFWTYTKYGPGSMDHPMDLIHGPGQRTSLVFIATSLRVCLAKRVALGSRPHKWEDHKLVLRYRKSSAFLPSIFSFGPTLSNWNSIGKTHPSPAYYTLSCVKIRFKFCIRPAMLADKDYFSSRKRRNTVTKVQSGATAAQTTLLSH